MKRKRPNRAKLVLFALALTVTFITGAASSLLYVYLHPVAIQVQATCMFKLPGELFEPL